MGLTTLEGSAQHPLARKSSIRSLHHVLMIHSQWHKSTSNVKRSNAVIKRIATMFRDQVDVVPIIAPLNEYVAKFAINRH